ncbi:protein EXECUTER 1, chloroplastic-like isoform X1 [Cynara cardunculus var. scolymus]|uniref:protein EXECUTER 1, chloroplastic-like isoform X1 n=1 Tax=Cynara cardunculus var. scolymus TaxID=59895 RepID=UPI000D62A740|nr:protein EXECUTER 1, chloroplastic-like isoform X1 [Cynara cardunculus var. scolymus]
MASISPPTFPSSAGTPATNPHKFTSSTPKFITRARLNHRSSYPTHLFPHSPSRVSAFSSICRCHSNHKDIGDNNDKDKKGSRRWDSAFQENIRNTIKWFDDYMTGYWKYQKKDDEVKKDDSGDGVVKIEGEVVVDGDGDKEWDWERWKKHFTEVDEQERVVSILKSHLNRAVVKEDYEDAARIKVAIAAAATNDTVGKVMSHLSKAIEEERYMDATFVRDYANAGLVGWWAGLSDDSKDPYGRIIHISAEHGRYLARSYSPRQLAMSADGAPLFEIFLTVDENGEYKHQAVYLKRTEVPRDFPVVSSKSSGLISSMNPPDTVRDKGDPFAKDIEDKDDGEDMDDDSDMAEESAFENILRDMIPGAKDLKVKVLNVTTPGKIDRDLISKVVKQIVEEEDEKEKDRDSERIDGEDEVKGGTDEDQDNIDVNSGDSIVDSEGKGQIAVKIVVGGLVQRVSNGTSRKDLLRVPAKLEKKSRSSFSFSVEKEKQQVSSGNAQSLKNKDARIHGIRSTDSVMVDLAKSIGRGKIPIKVLKDVGQLINVTLSQARNRQPLSGSTTFNRIELPATKDPLNGLYVGSHGLYTSEVIHLRRKFGQWEEDGNMKELSNMEFYEYVEAVKLTGEPYVPAGQVAFRAKIGTKYQLPHKGIIPEEFGVIARYQGQGRLAEPGFRNPRWVDGELVILDGKYIKEGPVVGFVYWAPEYHFLVFFNQLRLKN